MNDIFVVWRRFLFLFGGGGYEGFGGVGVIGLLVLILNLNVNRKIMPEFRQLSGFMEVRAATRVLTF